MGLGESKEVKQRKKILESELPPDFRKEQTLPSQFGATVYITPGIYQGIKNCQPGKFARVAAPLIRFGRPVLYWSARNVGKPIVRWGMSKIGRNVFEENEHGAKRQPGTEKENKPIISDIQQLIATRRGKLGPSDAITIDAINRGDISEAVLAQFTEIIRLTNEGIKITIPDSRPDPETGEYGPFYGALRSGAPKRKRQLYLTYHPGSNCIVLRDGPIQSSVLDKEKGKNLAVIRGVDYKDYTFSDLLHVLVERIEQVQNVNSHQTKRNQQIPNTTEAYLEQGLKLLMHFSGGKDNLSLRDVLEDMIAKDKIVTAAFKGDLSFIRALQFIFKISEDEVFDILKELDDKYVATRDKLKELYYKKITDPMERQQYARDVDVMNYVKLKALKECLKGLKISATSRVDDVIAHVFDSMASAVPEIGIYPTLTAKVEHFIDFHPQHFAAVIGRMHDAAESSAELNVLLLTQSNRLIKAKTKSLRQLTDREIEWYENYAKQIGDEDHRALLEADARHQAQQTLLESHAGENSVFRRRVELLNGSASRAQNRASGELGGTTPALPPRTRLNDISVDESVIIGTFTKSSGDESKSTVHLEPTEKELYEADPFGEEIMPYDPNDAPDI